jgi:hypothetical protein
MFQLREISTDLSFYYENVWWATPAALISLHHHIVNSSPRKFIKHSQPSLSTIGREQLPSLFETGSHFKIKQKFSCCHKPFVLGDFHEMHCDDFLQRTWFFILPSLQTTLQIIPFPSSNPKTFISLRLRCAVCELRFFEKISSIFHAWNFINR